MCNNEQARRQARASHLLAIRRLRSVMRRGAKLHQEFVKTPLRTFVWHQADVGGEHYQLVVAGELWI